MHAPLARLALLTSLFLATSTGCVMNARTSRERMAPVPGAAAPAPQLASLRGSHATPAIGDFVRDHNAQLQLCYDGARAKQKTLGGKATIGVTLADDGRVLAASILERSWYGGNGGDVERCLLGVVQRWRFPEVEKSQQHAHTFSVVFSS